MLGGEGSGSNRAALFSKSKPAFEPQPNKRAPESLPPKKFHPTKGGSLAHRGPTQAMRTPPASRKPRRCQSHCAACGSHFFSDSAFDAHRKQFVCWEEGCDERVRILTENAICEISSPPRIGVVLYGVDTRTGSNSPSLAPSGPEDGLDPGVAA